MKIDDKVVCVKNNYQHMRGQKVPTVGEIYTVRDIRYFPGYGTGIWLVEIVNDVVLTVYGKMEMGFDVDGFRPVDRSFGEQVAEKLEVFFVPLEAAYKEQQHED